MHKYHSLKINSAPTTEPKSRNRTLYAISVFLPGPSLKNCISPSLKIDDSISGSTNDFKENDLDVSCDLPTDDKLFDILEKQMHFYNISL